MSDAWVEWLCHRSTWFDRLDTFAQRHVPFYRRWRIACGADQIRRLYEATRR